jgi:hypothetical protein
VEDQEHVDGPLAQALDRGELGRHLVVGQLRQALELELEIEPQTLAAVTEHARGLDRVAPERIFGAAAPGDQTYRASSAFFVLGNGLFISLGGLLPQLNLGLLLLIVGLSGLVNTLLLIVDLWQRGRRELGQGFLLAAGSFAIYLGEALNGVGLLRHPGNAGGVDSVTYLLLLGYAIGLARAWELVGGRYYGLIATIRHRGRVSLPPAGDEQPDAAQAAAHLPDSPGTP